MNYSSKKLFSVFFITLITIGICSAQTQVNNKSNSLHAKNKNAFKKISGYVTYKQKPLANVNISVKNTKIGTKTSAKGFYTINAKKGAVIKFSFVGLQPVEVVVEDVTRTLNIDMKMINNDLDEVVINHENKKNIKAGFNALDKPIRMPTHFGKINPLAGSISYIKGEDLNLAAPDILSAILYRMPSLRPTNFINVSSTFLWDIDGILFTNPPYIDVNEVVDIAVLRSLSDIVPYGSEGRNGVIIVRTKRAYFDVNNPYAKHNPYTNKNYYKGDAKNSKELNTVKPKYMQSITTNTTSFKALNTYNKLKSLHQNNINYYIDVANYFKHKYNNLNYFYKVLNDAEMILSKNPVALKALAYTYQGQGAYQKAVAIYKKIIRLRPKYAQSYRDLANAYANEGEYKNAWKIYMYYLYKGNKLDQKGIGSIIYDEMEWLYKKNNKVSNSNEFLISKNQKNTKKDVRIVFEWNDSETSFALEFVNPQNQSYTFEHSYYANKKLITDEKTKGYSSSEFYINKLKKGNWLVNLTYLGNKKNTPVYLKTTVYTHWGLPNQKKKIKIYKLANKNVKVQLFKLNAEKNNYLSLK